MLFGAAKVEKEVYKARGMLKKNQVFLTREALSDA
jgi:hypothetical protein